jgi:hypothetical protein
MLRATCINKTQALALFLNKPDNVECNNECLQGVINQTRTLWLMAHADAGEQTATVYGSDLSHPGSPSTDVQIHLLTSILTPYATYCCNCCGIAALSPDAMTGVERTPFPERILCPCEESKKLTKAIAPLLFFDVPGMVIV